MPQVANAILEQRSRQTIIAVEVGSGGSTTDIDIADDLAEHERLEAEQFSHILDPRSPRKSKNADFQPCFKDRIPKNILDAL